MCEDVFLSRYLRKGIKKRGKGQGIAKVENRDSVVLYMVALAPSDVQVFSFIILVNNLLCFLVSESKHC